MLTSYLQQPEQSINLLYLLQAGTGDDFLDDLLSNDASLDDGTVPDGMDSSINMTGNEVRLQT
jgi:hypothetical protein